MRPVPIANTNTDAIRSGSVSGFRGVGWLLAASAMAAGLQLAAFPLAGAFGLALSISFGLALLAVLHRGEGHQAAAGIAGALMTALMLHGSLEVTGMALGLPLFVCLMAGEALVSAAVCAVFSAQSSHGGLGGAIAVAINIDGKYGGIAGRVA